MVSRGEQFTVTASFWNELQRMVKWWKGHENGFIQIAEELQRTYPPSIVWVKNASGTRRAAFEVLTVSDIVADIRTYDSERYRPIHFHGITPTIDPLYSVCVLQEPASVDGFARAVIAGATLCKLNITHAADMWCDVSHGIGSYLTTHCLGRARVILKNSGTGSSDKWGIVRIGDRSDEILVRNETGNPIASGFNGTASVYTGTPHSESATGQTISVANKTDVDWADDAYAWCALIGGYGPYISPIQSS